MLRSPITKEGNIRFIEIIKLSILIGFFYALLSAVIEANYSVILGCSGVSSVIVTILSIVNAVVVLKAILTEIKEYLTVTFIIDLPEITYIIKERMLKLANPFSIRNLYQTINVVRC